MCKNPGKVLSGMAVGTHQSTIAILVCRLGSVIMVKRVISEPVPAVVLMHTWNFVIVSINRVTSVIHYDMSILQLASTKGY